MSWSWRDPRFGGLLVLGALIVALAALRAWYLLAIVAGLGLGIYLYVLLVRGHGPRQHRGERLVEDPSGPEWLNLDEAAQLLGTSPEQLLALTSREEVPFYVLARGSRSDPATHFFHRPELEGWAARRGPGAGTGLDR